ncbi:uncharacterized protein LOC134704953 [Mytilus trossulus]|uniref:uncharacterized protein LOC134704953 n=1 Tax=Mytilus trossulus TaxID=6551 RepID=UPI0030065326
MSRIHCITVFLVIYATSAASISTSAPERKFEGTIFVSSASIGILIGLLSVTSVIILFCVVCRLCNGSAREKEQVKELFKPVPECNVKVKEPKLIKWEKPEYTP